MFDYSELYFCSWNFSSYIPPPQLKTISSLSTWSILDLRGGSYFFFPLELCLSSLPTNSFPPWQVAESRLKTESTWLSRLACAHSGKLPGFHLTHYSVLWRHFGFWLSYSEYLFILSTFHYLHIFLFIQQVFNELLRDTRSCSKSQGWSREPAYKFLLLGNWCSLKVAFGLNLSKLGLPE